MFKLTTGGRTRESESPEYVVTEFDAFQYLHHLRRRLRFILLICAGAGAVALLVSLVLPKQYTATASIVIDPPRSDDPRTTVALTQIYLESLKSYELLASSDTLFQRAMDRFHLRDDGSSRPLESWKRRALKVTKVRDTKVLEIAATLPDPRKAQALAQFLAEETVTLSGANDAGDQNLVKQAQRETAEARAKLERDQAALRDFSQRAGLPGVRADLESLTSLLKNVRQDLADSRTEAAQFTATGDSRLQASRARMTSLESQAAELERRVRAQGAELARAEARIEELEKNASVEQSAYDAAQLRVQTLQASAGMRGERLRVVDPGVVPERPSSPNVGLNVALALAAALLVSLTYLTLTFRRAGYDDAGHDRIAH